MRCSQKRSKSVCCLLYTLKPIHYPLLMLVAAQEAMDKFSVEKARRPCNQDNCHIS